MGKLARYLMTKTVNVMLTNVCPKSCGGCNQHCELFTKYLSNEQWHIPLKQLEDTLAVLAVRKVKTKIGLHGGDVTAHPQWEQILEIVAASQERFTMVTKKQLGKIPSNLRVYRAPTKKDQVYAASLVSLGDYLPTHDFAPDFCNCSFWKRWPTMIYDNKAFICSPAAGYERLKFGKANWDQCHGWTIELGKEPFDHTDAEILMQIKETCRCCVFQTANNRAKQWTSQPTVISAENADVARLLPTEAFWPFIKIL